MQLAYGRQDKMATPRSNRGFTLIELLIVVAIIGIIAGVAIPNMLKALHRTKQNRTMADIRAFASALHMYEDDVAMFPVSSEQDAAVLSPLLSVYLKTVIADDGWGNPIRYTSNGRIYTLVSYGRDGVPTLPYTFGPTTSLDADLLFSQGMFIQYPEGVQTD